MPLLLVQKVPFVHLNDSHLETLRSALPGLRLEFFEDAPEESQIRDTDYILGNPSPELLSRFERLRFVQLCTAGADPYMQQGVPAGLTLATATGAYGQTISEHMLALLLGMMHRLPHYLRQQDRQEWKPVRAAIDTVFGATVLVWGLGDIGGEFARHMKMLGASTIGVRRAGRDKPDYLDELHDASAIDELLPRADVVAMSLPGTAATAGILSRERIGRMKPGAYLLNVGRGTAIDQEALCEALEAGRLAGAGLDVTSPEPLPAGHRLWSTPGCVITPHAAGWGPVETTNRIVAIAAENLAAVAEGRPARNELDPATGYRRLR